ncbi:MAG: DUF4238 domain-containing protein [Acidobacteriota bacterium]|nr:DUF4238 domain-containing protein [Acidobacteriota bacterium]
MSEPRAHHYVPQCWLKGFTATGEANSRLWVSDYKRNKQWPSTPENTGHIRDFYRVDVPNLDPEAFENNYSEYESAIAPTLNRLLHNPRPPSSQELEDLLTFMAVQWTRVPKFRPTVLAMTDRILRVEMEKQLRSPASWSRYLTTAGIPADAPGTAEHRTDRYLYVSDLFTRCRESPSGRTVDGTQDD